MTDKLNQKLQIFPVLFDGFFVNIIVYVTGLNFSPYIFFYLTFTSLHSMILQTKKGLFALYFGLISYIIMGFLVSIKIIQYVNVFSSTLQFNSTSYLLSLFLLTITNITFYKIFRNFVKSNYQLLKKLQELDKLKTQFFANISHELRTPLTLIRTPLEGIVRGTVAPAPNLFESMYRNSTRLLSLISTLLDFSRIEEGRLALDRTVQNISDIVAGTVSSIDSVAAQRGLYLSTDIQNEIYALVDRAYIEKALYNLLSNALKFTPQGGKITVSLHQHEGKCTITVADTGIGIPEDKIETIFDRFSQIDGTTSRKFEGSGIGLSFASEIVAMHEGTISVQSKEGEGSTFIITLDAQIADTILQTVQESTAETVIQREYIEAETASALNNTQESGETHSEDVPLLLIVDDNSDMRSLLKGILQSIYRTVEAENGKHALEVISSLDTPPDLVLSDVMMPYMDGYEMTAALRKNPDFEGLPIILLTAKAAKENYLEGFYSGAIDYVVKPFHAGELKSRIKAQLEMKKLRDRLQRSNEVLYEKLKTMIAVSESKLDLDTEHSKQEDKNRKKEFDPKLLQKLDLVEQFIRENFTRDLSREGIASASGLSPDYMTRKYTQVKGIRMFDFVRDLRLEHAATLLKESE